MTSPLPNWGDLEPYYSCANCHRKANDLQLCPECKAIRYCDDGCRSGNHAYHETHCHLPGKLPWQETIIPTFSGPLNPAHPSNPLQLRSQPVLTPEALDALRTYDCPPPPAGHNWGQAKLTAELKKRPDSKLQFRAADWFDAAEEKKSELLCHEKTKEELVKMLREWVYERTKVAEEDRAYVIAVQVFELAQNTDTLEPDDMPKSQKARFQLPPAMEMVKRELDADLEGEDGKEKTSALGKLKSKAKGVLHLGGKGSGPDSVDDAADASDEALDPVTKWMIEVPVYMTARTHQMTHFGSWLHKSLLKKLPEDHNYSRFEGSRQGPPDSEIVATLLELQVPGIDEGSFWVLEDTRDRCVLVQGNQEFVNQQGNEARAKMQRKLKRYGVEDKVHLPEILTDEGMKEHAEKLQKQENILVRE